jgi:hypothetical protein
MTDKDGKTSPVPEVQTQSNSNTNENPQDPILSGSGQEKENSSTGAAGWVNVSADDSNSHNSSSYLENETGGLKDASQMSTWRPR